MSNDTTVDVLPKKLIWNNIVKKNFRNAIESVLPDAANTEVCRATLDCYGKGLTAEDVEIGRDVDLDSLSALRCFCKTIRVNLLHKIGVVLVKGLDLQKLGGIENIEKLTACSKIAYYLMSSLIGTSYHSEMNMS